jgi:hypothetical protein
VTSSANNQFTARASGGIRFFSNSALNAGVSLAPGAGSWSNLSDAGVKRDRRPLDARAVLEGLARLPIETWSYESQDPAIRHAGPMAQDFRAMFGLGEDDKHISTVDADGVALAAIQALHLELQEKDREIDELRARLSRLESKMD